MEPWNIAIQHLLDWIDEHAIDNPSLTEISNQVGYSPYYCSEQFRRVTGTTIKAYMAARRLALATLAIRDSSETLISIAMDYGFSSQSALTRAFTETYGCTPAAYRRNPKPLPLTIRKTVLTPEMFNPKGETEMSNIVIPHYRMEYIPAHKTLAVYQSSETSNGKIWPNHDCDLLCGYLESMPSDKTHPILSNFAPGWVVKNGERHYFFGAGVNIDYADEIPEGFELRGEFPGSYYLVFYHPPFDYLSENIEVMKRVEEMAWNFDPHTIGYEWNEDMCQIYQRHYPEGLGYQVLRPVKKIEK